MVRGPDAVRYAVASVPGLPSLSGGKQPTFNYARTEIARAGAQGGSSSID